MSILVGVCLTERKTERKRETHVGERDEKREREIERDSMKETERCKDWERERVT